MGLIVAITVVDIHSPESVHLGPLLVVAPAITVSFGGAWLTGLVGALAVAAQVVIGVLHGGLYTANHISQIVGLTVLSVMAMIVCLARDRRSAELVQVRSVSETARRALLRPLPPPGSALCTSAARTWPPRRKPVSAVTCTPWPASAIAHACSSAMCEGRDWPRSGRRPR
nr:hypothetical protein [Streptomyces sp. NRRL S-813]